MKLDDDGLKAALKNAMNARGLKLGLAAAALDIKAEFTKYPQHKPRPQAPYWTPKQRRGFWAKLNKGEIEVPYVRGSSKNSQKLGQSWTTEARNSGLTQVIGTAVGYARLVQSAAKQTRYHKKTGWRTEKQIMQAEAPKAIKTITFYIQRDI
ncbi:MAG: hypothetical protein LCI00_16885 [Chloroflexi bacterium]|nr:hypothetical protein [Chloroflexota bacterium]